MSEMIERAAQAVVAKQCERDGGMDVWSELAECAKDEIRQEVRVVLETLRDWLAAQPASADDEIREQVGAIALINAALA